MSTTRGRIPTTDEIRNWATYVPDGNIGMHISERDAAAFERWLADHDAATRAAAFEEAEVWIETTRINGAYPDYEEEYEMARAFRAAKEGN